MTTHQTGSFGEQLRHFREAAGLSQEELAERADLTASGIGALERGHRKHPYPHTVQMLASALGLTDAERAAFITSVPRRGHEPSGADVLDASPPMVTALSSLPVPLSPLIGRANEVSALTSMLRSQDVRLVSLTGPGGVGKTRLLLEVASQVQSDFADGVVWIDLSPVRDTHHVLGEIAQAVRVSEMPGQSILDSLTVSLRHRQILFLLDNFEQVVEAAPQVVALCQSCPRLTALVTSRTTLRVRGEQEFPVHPLPVPDPTIALRPSDLEQVDAVRLFLQRVRAAVPDFSLASDTAATIAAICVRLDGLPLALELAAVRLKYLAPPTLLDWLDKRLAVLVDGTQDLPARQQTLRDTLAWSHDLLTPYEQVLFRRLAVFAGGFRREDVESVCRAEDRTVEQTRRALSSLVDKNMLHMRGQGSTAPRFLMLETIREYAHEQLSGSGEEGRMRQRHAENFLALAEEAEPHLVGTARGEWIEIVEHEQDNLHAALQWSLLEGNDAELGGRLAAALVWFWYLRGHISAGRRWLDRALALGVPGSLLHAKTLFGAGMLAYLQYDLDAARANLEESVAIYRALAEKHGLARALSVLAGATVAEGDAVRASDLCRESLTLLQAEGEEGWEAATLIWLGDATCRLGDPAAAKSIWERSAAVSGRREDRWVRATALWFLGVLAASQGSLDTAAERYRESMRLFREFGDNHGLTLTLVAMAASAWQRGENHEAERLWREALTLLRNLGNQTFTGLSLQAFAVLCLSGLAQVAMAMQHRERAARLSGAATSQFRALSSGQIISVQTMFPVLFRAVRDEELSAGLAGLDDPRWRASWKAGRAMTLDEAVSFALSE